MPLSPGEKLGPYEIIEKIGAGGMGEVFRARDPRLGRDVAIKVSGERFSERFDREARAIASLNHPNICTLHDIGPNYLVMELVEGESPRGPLPLDTALNYARQIAAALEEAHSKGVVHRDLKPGNIRVKPDGTIKVLDFGLAKVAPDSSSESRPEDSPTMTMAATQAGMILGTAAYMAPEQAKGKVVDKRADIWAFGVVLYEMILGERPFKGDDISDILAAVIKEKPDLSGVPPQVRPLLERCLEKDPAKRLRDIGDMELLLALPPTASRPGLAWPAIAIAVVVTVALAEVSYIHFRETPSAPPQLLKFEIAPPPKTTLRKFSVSPDGRMVAFNSDSFDGHGGLWVRSLDSVESRRVADADIDPAMFFWSPDSRFLAYPLSNKIMKVDVTGGPPETICETKSFAIGGSWNREGTIIFGTFQGSLWKVPAAGGVPSLVTTLDASRQEQNHLSPVFLPDGDHFLYLRMSAMPANTGIYLGSLDAKPGQQSLKRLVASDFAPAYAPSSDSRSGYLLFAREGALMAQTIDVAKLALASDPVRITDHVGGEYEFGGFSASANGMLAYRTGGVGGYNSVQLTWFDRKGTPGAATVPGTYLDFALSPDAASVAVHRVGSGINGDIWRMDFARNTMTRLTADPGDDLEPVWSPDGSRVAYVSNRGDGSGLFQKASNGTGAGETLLPPHGFRDLNDWSRDGNYLVYSELNEKTKFDLWILPMNADRKPAVYLNSEFNEAQGQFAPDGHWIAYVSDESGRPEIYVQPFPLTSGGAKFTISNTGGLMPRWRRDGKELYFIANGRQIMAADVTYTPDFKIGIPHQLFESAIPGDGANSFVWDVSPDGKRFLLPKPMSAEGVPQSPITVVLNWTAPLKK